jgi:long-chain fatty acid transport protein
MLLSYHPPMKRLTFLLVCQFFAGYVFAGGPYPAFSGISATNEDAAVAGLNPAAMTYFDKRESRFELLGFFSESTWKGNLGESEETVTIDDDSSLLLPVAAMVMPIRDNWWFGFTVQGAGFTEEFDDDWPGRYFLQEYELLYISAFPSIATKLTDRLSVAGSLALTYTTYDQRKAVPNIDPGFEDGSLLIETDDVSVGFSLSMIYDISSNTRFGAVYRSAQEPELDGKAKFSGLGPVTESILEGAGLIGAQVDVTSKQPQSVTAGIAHDFENGNSLTFDAVWADYSEFTLAEVYVNGDQIIANEQEYDDIFALSASFSWPLKDKWRLGVGGFYVSDMIGDEDRTLAFTADSIWSLGVGFEWQWKENRTVTASLNYLEVGDAPVSTPGIPVIGSVTGAYTNRQTIYFRIAISLQNSAG